jgi:hypothetical protein
MPALAGVKFAAAVFGALEIGGLVLTAVVLTGAAGGAIGRFAAGWIVLAAATVGTGGESDVTRGVVGAAFSRARCPAGDVADDDARLSFLSFGAGRGRSDCGGVDEGKPGD